MTEMETKETKNKRQSKTYFYENGVRKEFNPEKPKRLSALGEWLSDPDRKPFLKIIDMGAVLK